MDFWPTFTEYLLRILESVKWPLTILIVAFFFRRVVAYLFLSLEEYNFFGARGVIKDPETVIRERVEERVRRAAAEQERQRERKAVQQEIENLRQSKQSSEKTIAELSVLAEKLAEDKQRFSSEISSLLEKIQFLEMESNAKDFDIYELEKETHDPRY